MFGKQIPVLKIQRSPPNHPVRFTFEDAHGSPADVRAAEKSGFIVSPADAALLLQLVNELCTNGRRAAQSGTREQEFPRRRWLPW